TGGELFPSLCFKYQISTVVIAPAPASTTTTTVFFTNPALFFYRSNLQRLLLPEMAYVDHAFSITDEDIMMDSPFTVNNRPPIKEIALAVSLLVFGMIGIIVGAFMASNRVGGDRAHGVFFSLLGGLLFIPGFYYTRIAYYAYKGYKGFSFSNIPPV
uniref:Transmembrane protein 230 n=2 Tax=Cucumis melo TaxID=3656 RepID=A0A9I9DF86_CUCME